MKMKFYYGALALIWLLSGCTPKVPSTVDNPRAISSSSKIDTVAKKRSKHYYSSPSQYNKRKSSYTNKRSTRSKSGNRNSRKFGRR